MSKSIAVFGEMLWDLLPSGKQAGGAPMNVALHLNNLGIETKLISRVGQDELGEELLAFVQEKGLETTWIQRDEKEPTGVVNVNMDDEEEVVYDIVQPSAWDKIEADAAAIEAVGNADVLVFESLANRHATSRESLSKLLELAQNKTKAFDTNLRPPFYDKQMLEYLLLNADILKINHHELEEVYGWSAEGGDLKEQILYVANKYLIREVIATRGANGAAYLGPTGWVEHSGYKVQVQDTIGAGDSFFAAFLARWVEGQSPAKCLDFACALGAMVASHKGANPPIKRADIEAFINQNQVS